MLPEREETRKVQQLGSSTLALSLPSEWADKHGIEKGDSITIRQNSEALSVLSPSGSARGSEAVVHAATVDGKTLERIIVAQYILGRRVIDVETQGEALSGEAIDAVYGAEKRLMGLGVIEETASRISIRCSIDPGDFTLDQLLERLESTGRTMRQDAVKALAYGNPNLATRAINRERQASKIFILLLRLVFSAYGIAVVQTALGLESGRALIGYRAVAKNLELAANAANELAGHVIEIHEGEMEIDEATTNDIRSLADRVNDLSAAGVQAFIERDFEQTVDIRSGFRHVDTLEDAVLENLDGSASKEELTIREILHSLQRAADYTARNGEIASTVALDGDSAFVTVR